MVSAKARRLWALSGGVLVGYAVGGAHNLTTGGADIWAVSLIGGLGLGAMAAALVRDQ